MTAARITKLTAKQEAFLPAFRERWRAVGLSVVPINADVARRAVRELYRVGGMGEPPAVIVLASPMACMIAHSIVTILLRQGLRDGLQTQLQVQLRDQLWDQLWGQLVAQLGDQIADQLRAQLVAQLRAQLRAQLQVQLGNQLRDQLGVQIGDQLRGQLGAHLWGQFVAQIEDQLRDQLRAELGAQLGVQLRDQLQVQLRDQLWDQLGAQLRGQPRRSEFFHPSSLAGGQEAFWLAFYEFGEHIGVRYEPHTKARFETYRVYALSAGWMFPYKAIAFVSDRPSALHFDAQRRLHCASGPAVKFRDGWSVHAWHGLRVPAEIIEDPDFRPDAIENQSNVELRRVMLEREYGGRSGFELYLAARNVRLIAADELHGQPRRLFEATIAGTPLRIVEVINGSSESDGTRRKFLLGAMPGKTPHEVIAASYGINPDVYREAVRT